MSLTLVLSWLGLGAPQARADDADAATARYTIAVFTTSPADGCFDTGVIKAIELFARRRIGLLNHSLEFRDRKFRVKFYNDHDDPKLAVANVRKAIDDPATLAMVGLSGATRSKAVFEALGTEIAARNIPLLSDISVTGIFAPYKNVFTMRPSQDNERLPVIGRFLKDGNFQRPVYIGATESVASTELTAGLKNLTDVPPITDVHLLAVKDDKLDAAEISSTIADIKAKSADMLLIMLPASAIEQFLTEAMAAGLSVPAFLLTDNEKALKNSGAAAYGANLYQLAWQSLPDIYNNRLRKRMLEFGEDTWVFDDTVNKGASGWAAGTCKMPEGSTPLGQFDSRNLRAIGRATRFADMIGLIGEITKYAAADSTLQALRGQIVEKLTTTYAAGHGTFRGNYDNWSFYPDSRNASQTPSILIRPRGSSRVQLAPTQYVKLRNDSLRPIQTLYMDVNLIRIFRVDDNEKSFFAEFYLTMNSGTNFDIANLDFSNAFVDADSSGEKISITPLHRGEPSGVYPQGVQIYKVMGKFMMNPDFSRYPFDTQLFSIGLQPKNGEAAFIIQPPPERLRDLAAETEGWSLHDQFVGYDEDFIPIIDARSEERSIVPFYKVDFSWVMQREATDYYLRVVIPLAFILIVAYLSIFIPRNNFEAVVTIQVTALLSAVALYLSIPKVGAEAATISDNIFLLNYMAVSIMIAISIMRVNPWLRRFSGLGRALKIIHVVGIPLLILALTFYVGDMKVGEYAQSWQSGGGQL